MRQPQSKSLYIANYTTLREFLGELRRGSVDPSLGKADRDVLQCLLVLQNSSKHSLCKQF